jgi:hypothetical protein
MTDFNVLTFNDRAFPGMAPLEGIGQMGIRVLAKQLADGRRGGQTRPHRDGGMFTVVKVSENLTSSGWYEIR